MLNKRPIVGIPFNYDESWIGGTYYIKNLVSALKLLPSDEQPDIWILCHAAASFEFILKATSYPRLHWMQPALIQGIDGGISRRTKILNFITPWFLKKKLSFDLIFPYPIDTRLQQTACWIPDFQDKCLPSFFDAAELVAREKQHRDYFTNYRHVVFSSQAANADFDKFYPEAKCERHVINFAVSEPESVQIDDAQVRSKYNLSGSFFYCPNQFWIHKNHSLVIDAVEKLRTKGVKVKIAFSGKEHDHRAPDHTKNLKARVKALGLEEDILFLGFIPRDDQMVIFKSASAIVQPSLFEGWSTVIEDAKSVSQYVLASRIPANTEQISSNVEFFDPHSSEELQGLLEKYAVQSPKKSVVPYVRYQLAFAHDFMTLVRRVQSTNQLPVGTND